MGVRTAWSSTSDVRQRLALTTTAVHLSCASPADSQVDGNSSRTILFQPGEVNMSKRGAEKQLTDR